MGLLGNGAGPGHVSWVMPTPGVMDLIVLLAFLAVLFGLYLLVRVIRRAWDGGSAARVRELESRVRDLEDGR